MTSLGIPGVVLPDTHAARGVVRAMYVAIAAADLDAILPLVQRSAMDAWYAALLRSPHDVWELQEWRDFASMPVADLPAAVEDGLRYVLEAIPADERERIPEVGRARAGEPGQVGVEVSLLARTDDDPASDLEASPPFVVNVQHDPVDDTWRVVPHAAGAFPFPGLAWGLVMAVIPTGLDAEALSLEIRLEPAADPASAVALRQWLEACGCQVRAHETWTPGWLALAVMVPAATMASHGTSFVHMLCAYPIVRQVWRADETR